MQLSWRSGPGRGERAAEPDLRDAPDSRDEDLGAVPAVGVARFAGAEALSLASFVALRLASGGAESAHALAHGCTRSEARWELGEEALEGALAQLRAKLLTLVQCCLIMKQCQH